MMNSGQWAALDARAADSPLLRFGERLMRTVRKMGEWAMRKPDRGAGYLLAGLLGAVAGGAVVIIATRAIPRMMSQMMRAMMQDRMAQMEEMGCEPSEI